MGREGIFYFFISRINNNYTFTQQQIYIKLSSLLWHESASALEGLCTTSYLENDKWHGCLSLLQLALTREPFDPAFAHAHKEYNWEDGRKKSARVGMINK